MRVSRRLILGIICLFPIASGSAVAWFTFNATLRDIGELRTVEELVAHPPGYDGVLRVKLTPEPSRSRVVQLSGSPEATLVPVAESAEVALLVFTSPKSSASTAVESGESMPGSGTRTFVVHRDGHSVPNGNGPLILLANDEQGVTALSVIEMARPVTLVATALGVMLVTLGARQMRKG